MWGGGSSEVDETYQKISNIESIEDVLQILGDWFHTKDAFLIKYNSDSDILLYRGQINISEIVNKGIENYDKPIDSEQIRDLLQTMVDPFLNKTDDRFDPCVINISTKKSLRYFTMFSYLKKEHTKNLTKKLEYISGSYKNMKLSHYTLD